LAGSEKAGLDAADPDLFVNALCILTPGGSTRALKKIRVFWQTIGSRITLMKPDVHDRILASTSHAPHAVAFALIASIDSKNRPFAAGGLRDTTRVALSHPEIWKDIFLSNSKNILASIALFEKELTRLKTALGRRDASQLLKFLTRARAKRQRIFAR
jgi:prephenate dehydrogenase